MCIKLHNFSVNLHQQVHTCTLEINLLKAVLHPFWGDWYWGESTCLQLQCNVVERMLYMPIFSESQVWEFCTWEGMPGFLKMTQTCLKTVGFPKTFQILPKMFWTFPGPSPRMCFALQCISAITSTFPLKIRVLYLGSVSPGTVCTYIFLLETLVQGSNFPARHETHM